MNKIDWHMLFKITFNIGHWTTLDKEKSSNSAYMIFYVRSD